MNSIFGFPTIEAELTSLINTANADYGATFADGDLEFTVGEYDLTDQRQRFDVRDTSGRYFGIRDNMGIFKRNFQTLFKGIEIHVQAGSGLTNRAVIDALAKLYGLPKFEDSDFAPGLLDLNTDVDDEEVLVNWPFAQTSFSWTGTATFWLRNTKSSLINLITDDHIDAFVANERSGVIIDTYVTALPGLPYPTYFNLDDIIYQTDLEGLEYPNSLDLGILITVTELAGLEYPTSLDIATFENSLDGLEYFPSIALNLLSNSNLDGFDYPVGVGTSRYSSLLLTRPIDFSDYQNSIQRFRVGMPITDSNLVTVIVSKIAEKWSKLNNAADKVKLNLAFTNATVISINRVRSIYGFTETVTVRPSAANFIVGDAVLIYDIETTE